jgi:HAD superfamily hydrolase (TIGR01509 family)
MGNTKYILFDAANTLIHKPELWTKLQAVLKEAGYDVPSGLLKKNHKLLSECTRFPDRTSADFYRGFNAELLYSLGILPSEKLLDAVFSSCTYLEWERFEDTAALDSLDIPLGVLSNFNRSLKGLLEKKFGPLFRDVIISEEAGYGKPDLRFYEAALAAAGCRAEEILYIGDSPKLDVEPALKAGMRTLLIDRDNVYPLVKNRITSIAELVVYL